MKNLFQQADIRTDDRVISNHSGPITHCTMLFSERYDKTVMNSSKHSSTAVHAYQREQFELQSNVCADLEPVIPQEVNVMSSNKNKDNNNGTVIEATDLKPDVSSEGTCKNILKDKNPCDNVNQEIKDIMKYLDENTLVLQVPVTVKKVVILTEGGKKLVKEL